MIQSSRSFGGNGQGLSQPWKIVSRADVKQMEKKSSTFRCGMGFNLKKLSGIATWYLQLKAKDVNS